MCVFEEVPMRDKMSKRRTVMSKMRFFREEPNGELGANYIALRIGRINSESICLARMIWIFTLESVSPKRSEMSS